MEIFRKYDLNNDNKIDSSELKSLVTDIFKESHKVKELSEEHNLLINKTVEDLFHKWDLDKNKVIDTEEFTNIVQGMSIIEDTESLFYLILDKLLENSRALVYSSRVASVLKNIPGLISSSRPLAYASEVGESVRPLFHRNFVRFMYGLSWTYVFTDTGVKTYAISHHGREAMSYCCLDTSIFHTFASMALPAFTIHSIVKYSGKFLKKSLGESKISKGLPVILGLGSIPFIIHPLDHFTEFVMNNTIRKIYGHKIPGLFNHNHH